MGDETAVESHAGEEDVGEEDVGGLAAENARLRLELEEHQSLIASAEGLIVVQDGRLVFHNPAFAAMVTYAPADFTTRSFIDFVYPDDRVGLMQAYLAGMAGGAVPEEYEFRTVLATGGLRRYRIRPRPGQWGGRFALYATIAEAPAGRLSEAKYQHILDAVPTGVFEMDLDGGRFLRVNDRLCELLGYTRGELMALIPFEIVAPEHRALAGERRSRALRGLPFVPTAEYRLLGKDQREVWVLIDSKVIRHDDGTMSTIDVVQDITDFKRREAEVRRVEKLESLGLLAGGIAHDFNNLLTAILGNATIGRRHAGNPAQVAEVFEEVERACLRASHLTQQLLTISRGGAPLKRITAIGATLHECATLAVRGSRARCAIEIVDDLWSVNVDEGQIGQVITNLVINAEQSMPEGGAVAVVAGNLELGEASPLPLAGGRYVRISVADHGIGIPPEHLTNVFDPYFTTKQSGRGLGLATAHSIMQRHGGHITVESTLGGGTTVYLYLPASDQPATSLAPAAVVERRGIGRILLMDDEEVVRDLGEALLVALGYQATLVTNGDEAIARFVAAKEAGTPFDAVVLDLTISGGRGGKATIAELRRIDPGVRALVMSGYSNDPVLADPETFGFRLALCKPFTLDQLGVALATMLADE